MGSIYVFSTICSVSVSRVRKSSKSCCLVRCSFDLRPKLIRCCNTSKNLPMSITSMFRAAPRALGVLTLGCKPVNNALISNPELVKSCLNYLEPSENSCANYVTTGFYKRFIISMLITFETDESKARFIACSRLLFV